MPGRMLFPLILAACAPEPTPTTPDWDGITRLFAAECAGCHAAGGQAAGVLILPDDLVDDLASGAGQWVVPGDAAASTLWQALAGEGLIAPMPPAGPLPAEAVDAVAAWIDAGAAIPDAR